MHLEIWGVNSLLPPFIPLSPSLPHFSSLTPTKQNPSLLPSRQFILLLSSSVRYLGLSNTQHLGFNPNPPPITAYDGADSSNENILTFYYTTNTINYYSAT